MAPLSDCRDTEVLSLKTLNRLRRCILLVPTKGTPERGTDRFFPPLPHRSRGRLWLGNADCPAVTWHPTYGWVLRSVPSHARHAPGLRTRHSGVSHQGKNLGDLHMGGFRPQETHTASVFEWTIKMVSQDGDSEVVLPIPLLYKHYASLRKTDCSADFLLS